MLLGLALVVVGNILIWQSEEETTQYFTGWLIGVFLLAIAGGIHRKRWTRLFVIIVASVFVIRNEQRTTQPKGNIQCVNGEVRVIQGELKCVCTPPYVGSACDQCPPGAIIESIQSNGKPVCKTCKHQYIFPHCTQLQYGYKTETECNPNWVTSCRGSNFKLNPKTYPTTVDGIRNELYNVAKEYCTPELGGTVYCDKCKDGHAGINCCPDGFFGQNCAHKVRKCNFMGDHQAVLKNNEVPTDYGLVNPSVCYSLDDDSCSCGGEFIGDMMCESRYCINGKCSDVARVPEFDFRCECDVGVGPDCETPTCYGGTRMYNGTSICRCDAKHTDSHNGTLFDSCEIQNDGTCYPGLFGSKCEECQCAVNLTSYMDSGVTGQCAKNRYDVFERDFRTKELMGGCRESGICTSEPDDCGVKTDGTDRCLLFTNPETFTAILFGGDKCLDTTDSKCAVWEPCQPR